MQNTKHTITAFTIIVHGDPLHSKSHASAQKFIKAACASSQSISQVFFYGDATTICGTVDSSPISLRRLQQQWLALSKQYKFSLQSCITTAINRGIVDTQESEETNKKVNLTEGFELEGLGVLAEALLSSNKLIEFGA